MTVPASLSKWAHPPRSNTPRSSSSGPPGPCITPSTETCVVVVSFMGPAFLSWWSFSFDCTEARISSVERGSVLQAENDTRALEKIMGELSIAGWELKHVTSVVPGGSDVFRLSRIYLFSGPSLERIQGVFSP